MCPGSLRALAAAGRGAAEETSVDDSDRNDEAPQDGGREDQAGLEAALAARDAEVSELRRRLVETPRRIHELEAAKRDSER